MATKAGKKGGKNQQKAPKKPEEPDYLQKVDPILMKMSMNSQEVAVVYIFLCPFAARRRICVG